MGSISISGFRVFIRNFNDCCTSTTRFCVLGVGNCLKSCALLLKDGEVFAVGTDTCKDLHLGVSESAKPVKLDGLSGIAGISVCGTYGDALAYTKAGQVFVWGKNARPGSCIKPVLLPEPSNVVEAICIRGYYLALTRHGKVYEWSGINYYLSLKLNTPTVLAISDVVNIACGYDQSLALTKSGEVYSWQGNGNVYQLLPKANIPGETVTKIACGYSHSLVLTKSGKLFTWGSNNYGLGNAENCVQSKTPVQLGDNIGRFQDIAVNGWCTNAAVTEAGAIYMWGAGENDVKVVTPTLTQCIELQQVFATYPPDSNYTWRCKPSDPIGAESSTTMEKLNNIFNTKVNEVQDNLNLREKAKKLKINIEEMQQIQGRLHVKKDNVQKELEELEEIFIKKKENDKKSFEENRNNIQKELEEYYIKEKEHDESLLGKLRALVEQSIDSKSSQVDDIQKTLTKVEKENENLKEGCMKMEREMETLKKQYAKIEEDYRKQQEIIEKMKSTLHQS